MRSAFLEQSDLTESARERERERGKKKSDEPARNREVGKWRDPEIFENVTTHFDISAKFSTLLCIHI